MLLCTVLCSLCWCLAIASCRRRREAARLERESRSSELERGAVESQQQQQGKKTSTKKKKIEPEAVEEEREQGNKTSTKKKRMPKQGARAKVDHSQTRCVMQF